MKWKLVILLMCIVFVSGCADRVGGTEFACPVCNGQAYLVSVGDAFCQKFYLRCADCGLRSGKYDEFFDAMKVWKLTGGNL